MGGIACVFNHGVTRSGKSCTMFGLDGPGILAKSVEFILQSNEVFISAIEILGNKYYDVVSGHHIEMKESSATKVRIESMAQFNEAQSNIIKARTQKQTNQNLTSSRSHLIIKLNLCSNSQAEMGFIDLAGWEDPKGKDIDETKFINNTLSQLNTVLFHISNNQLATFKTPLLKQMKPYFSESAETLMLYHVSHADAKKGIENIKDVVANFKGEKRKLSSNVLAEIKNKRLAKS